MRKYNLNSANKRKLRVLGIDCQDGMAIEEYLVQAFKTAGLKDFPQLTDPAWRYEMRRVAESAGPSESLYDDSATFSQIESAIHRRMRFDRHSVCEAELAGRERWQADRPDALVVRFRYREPLDCDQALGDVSERETRRMIGVWQISVKLVEGLL